MHKMMHVAVYQISIVPFLGLIDAQIEISGPKNSLGRNTDAHLSN